MTALIKTLDVSVFLASTAAGLYSFAPSVWAFLGENTPIAVAAFLMATCLGFVVSEVLR